MVTHRFRPVSALVVAVTFFVLFVLAIEVGSLSAAGHDAGGGQVVIDCSGLVPPIGHAARGRCTATGAIVDRGKFSDDLPLIVHPHARTFFGRKGTIVFSVYRERGHWKIIKGTGAYDTVHGRGRHSPTSLCAVSGLGCAISFTMTGSVTR